MGVQIPPGLPILSYMTEIEQLNKAIEIAKKAHDGQYRRDGVTPYYNHVEAVMQRASKYGIKYSIVAALHDIIEDTKVTAADLFYEGFDADIIIAVELLTKKENVSYFDYLKQIKNNELAKRVKIADMISNLSDDPTDGQVYKYSRGLNFLIER